MKEHMVDHIRTIFGDRLVCIASYYMHDEQNYIFVFKKLEFQDIINAKGLNLDEPIVFFTEEELRDGKDVFSLEFLNIQYSYEMIYGKDLFKNMKFKKKNVRLQLEFELRSKLIKLRSEFHRIRSHSDLLRLVDSILPAFMPLVSGLLFLKNEKMTNSWENIFLKIQEKYKVSTAVLHTIYQYKLRNIDLEDHTAIIRDVQKFLTDIAEEVDRMRVGE